MEARLHGRYGKSDVVAYVPIMAGSQIETYITVEPHPENFSVLKEQMTRQQPGKRTLLHNIAISDRDGVIRFHWDHDNRAHRIAPDNGSAEAPTLCIPALLDGEGVDVVDLVKIDIEGGKQLLLGCFESWSKRVKVILIELHPFIDETFTDDWFASCVRSQGFRPFCNPMLDRPFPDGVEPKGRDWFVRQFGTTYRYLYWFSVNEMGGLARLT